MTSWQLFIDSPDTSLLETSPRSHQGWTFHPHFMALLNKSCITLPTLYTWWCDLLGVFVQICAWPLVVFSRERDLFERIGPHDYGTDKSNLQGRLARWSPREEPVPWFQSTGSQLQNFFLLGGSQSFLLFSPPTDWMRPTPIMEGSMPYSESTNVNVHLISSQKTPSQKPWPSQVDT